MSRWIRGPVNVAPAASAVAGPPPVMLVRLAALHDGWQNNLADLKIPMTTHRSDVLRVLRPYSLRLHTDRGNFPTNPPNHMKGIAKWIGVCKTAPQWFFARFEAHCQRHTPGQPSGAQ